MLSNLDTKSILVGAVLAIVVVKLVLPRVAPGLAAKAS